MKYLFVTTLMMITLFASAQTEKKNIIKANLLSPIYNTLNLSYEHTINETKSILVGGSYTDFEDFGNTYYNYQKPNRVQGGSITAEYRVYYSDKALSGGYVAPFTRYMYYKRDMIKNDQYYYYDPTNGTYIYSILGEKSEYHSAGLGFIAGYQVTVKDVLSFDFFGGPVYQILLKQNRQAISQGTGAAGALAEEYLSNNIPNRFLSGYGFRMGITIGMMF